MEEALAQPPLLIDELVPYSGELVLQGEWYELLEQITTGDPFGRDLGLEVLHLFEPVSKTS